MIGLCLGQAGAAGFRFKARREVKLVNVARLDSLVRSFAHSSSRRSVLAGLSAVAATLATNAVIPETEAKARHHHHRRKNHGKKRNKQQGSKNDDAAQTPEETPPAATPADPVTTADASCSAAGFVRGLTGLAGVAQTFVARRSGQLTSATVTMLINAEGNDFVMDIRSVDAAGNPATVLASTAINDVPETRFDQPPRIITGTFATPATVVEGQRYALAFFVAPQQALSIQIGQNPSCGDGNLFVDVFRNGTFINRPGDDLVFETFVTA
jgi:hypothetical protein